MLVSVIKKYILGKKVKTCKVRHYMKYLDPLHPRLKDHILHISLQVRCTEEYL